MSPKPGIRTVRLRPTTQQDIWARLSWVPQRERSLLMGVAIGGRHMLMAALTIRTPRRTVALTGAMVIILMRHLTTTTTQEPTAGMGALTALTDRRPPGLATIPTPGPMRGERPFRLRMAAEAQRRRIIRTPVRMLRRGKVRARMLSGAARMCHEETRARRWDITQLRTEP